MTWSYKSYSDSNFKNVVTLMEGGLKDINADYPDAVIILAMCDRKGGDFQGVIFYNDSLTSQTAFSKPVWNSQYFFTSKEDYTKIYDHMQNFLNNKYQNTISDQSKFWSRLAYSNEDGGDAYLTLFYPTSN